MARLARWQGLVAFGLLLVALAAGWLLFGDWLVRTSTEEAGTELLGTQVEISSLRVLERETAVELVGLSVADPFDSMRDLLSARGMRVEFDPRALLERKYVVTSLVVDGLGFDTPRRRPAPPADPRGFAAQTLATVHQWRQQFDLPALVMPRIDTVRQLALDPGQLASVQAARALATRADSLQAVVEGGVRAVPVEATIDSAREYLARLEGQSPASLGLDGTRRALADGQRILGQLDRVRDDVNRLAATVTDGVAALSAGVRAVDAARLEDYALVRRMLSLPRFEAPELGRAMFGGVSLDRFQQALYWLALAREYLPPGLDPETRPGPSRLRLDGRSVRFPKERAYPSFLLEAGRVNLSLRGGEAVAGSYRIDLRDVTTEPALVGRPAVIRVERTGGAAGAPRLTGGAVLDHRTRPARDSVGLVAGGLAIPGFALPRLPFRIEPGRGDTRLEFRLAGDDLRARWTLRSNEVTARFDSAAAGAPGPVEQILIRLFTALPGLEVEARLDGPVSRPNLSVRSNLDALLADRLRSVVGQELARAEALARSKVDSVVRETVAPIRARADSVRDAAEQRVEDARSRLDAERDRLEGRLRALGAGAVGDLLPGLPGPFRRPTPRDSPPAPAPAPVPADSADTVGAEGDGLAVRIGSDRLRATTGGGR